MFFLVTIVPQQTTSSYAYSDTFGVGNGNRGVTRVGNGSRQKAWEEAPPLACSWNDIPRVNISLSIPHASCKWIISIPYHTLNIPNPKH